MITSYQLARNGSLILIDNLTLMVMIKTGLLRDHDELIEMGKDRIPTLVRIIDTPFAEHTPLDPWIIEGRETIERYLKIDTSTCDDYIAAEMVVNQRLMEAGYPERPDHAVTRLTVRGPFQYRHRYPTYLMEFFVQIDDKIFTTYRYLEEITRPTPDTPATYRWRVPVLDLVLNNDIMY